MVSIILRVISSTNVVVRVNFNLVLNEVGACSHLMLFKSGGSSQKLGPVVSIGLPFLGTFLRSFMVFVDGLCRL